MDQFYFEEGYIEASYLVYIAEARVDFGPYIEENYIDVLYFDERGSWATIAAELEQVFGSVVEASGTWTSEFIETVSVVKIIDFTATISDAFTPTVTAAVTKNQTATLDSVATMVTEAVANRATDIALNDQINLSAQAARTASSQSSISASSTVTVTALSVQLAESTISSTTALTASGIISNKRPRIYTVNSVDLDTSTKKWGTASAKFNANADYLEIPDSADWNSGTWRTIDLQFRAAALGTTSTQTFKIEQYQDSSNYWFFEITTASRILSPQQDTLRGLRFVTQSGGVNTVNIGNTSLSNYSLTNWFHLRMVNDGSIIRFWINGQRITNTSTTYSSSATDFSAPLKFYQDGGLNPTTIYIDELLITKDILTSTSTASFTAPTDRYYPADQSNILVLSHFDTDFSDDLGLGKTGEATISATASLSVSATTVRTAASTQTATATVTAQAVKTTDVDSTQTATATQTIDSVRVRTDSSAQSSEFAVQAQAVKTTDIQSSQSSQTELTATVFRTKEFEITVSDAFTPTVTAQAQLAGVALLESQATISTSANITASATSSLESTAQIQAQVTQTIGVVATVNSEFAITADNQRVRYADSSHSSELAITVDNVRIRYADINANSTATLTADNQRVRYADLAASTDFTQSTAAEKITDVTVSLTSASTQQTINSRTRTTLSTLSSEFIDEITAVKTPGIGVQISSEFTQTAVVVKTTDVLINAGSLFTPTIDADAQLAGFALLESSALLSLTITRIQSGVFGTEETRGLVTTEDAYYIPAPVISPPAITSGLTISFWAQRDNTDTTYRYRMLRQENLNQPSQTIEFISGYDPEYPLDIVFTDAIRLHYPWDADERYAYWQNVVASDLDWHHYLFRYTTAPATWQLWVDGQAKTLSSTGPYNNIGPFYNVRAYVGRGGGFDNELFGSTNFAGAMAQIWGGPITDSQFAVTKFYNDGYVDLYQGQGYANQLPQPEIYNTLESPWTDVTGSDKTASDRPLYSPGLRAVFDSTVTAVFRVVTAGSFQADSSLAAAAAAQRLFAIAQAAEFTAQAQADTRIGIVAEITGESTLQAVIGVIKPLSAGINSEATVVCLPGFVEKVTAEFSAQATLDADVDLIPPTRAEADLTAEFTIQADVSSFTDSITLMVSAGALSCEATLIPPVRAEADLSSEFTITATIGSIEQFAVLVASSGTVTAVVSRTRGLDSEQNSAAALTTSIGKITGYSATLTGFYTTLTVGDVINIDPYLTLMILPESRILSIEQETRTIQILEESRQLIIEGY